MRRALCTTTSLVVLMLLPQFGWAQCGGKPQLPCRVSTNSPITRIKSFLAYVKATVRKGMSSSKRAAFCKTMEGYFDFDTMAKAALHKIHPKLTPAQRTTFTDLFKKMLAQNYLKKLVGHKKYKVQIRKQKIKGARAKVVTKLQKIGGSEEDTIDVEYRLLKAGGHWKVYDVRTDEVSLIRNYRSTFRAIYKKGGYTALIQHLKRNTTN